MGASLRASGFMLFSLAISAMIYQRRNTLEMRDRSVRLMPIERERSRWRRFVRWVMGKG